MWCLIVSIPDLCPLSYSNIISVLCANFFFKVFKSVDPDQLAC